MHKLEFENKSVTDMWKYLTSVMETCISDSVPLYKHTKRLAKQTKAERC